MKEEEKESSKLQAARGQLAVLSGSTISKNVGKLIHDASLPAVVLAWVLKLDLVSYR